jgi:hypothetical protein
MFSIYYEITIEKGYITCGAKRQISNYIETLGYIPGSTLRGALVSILINNKNKDFKDYYELFMSSHVIFCNAYPIYNDKKCFPIPLSYFTCKDYPATGIWDRKSHSFYNYAVKEEPECFCGAELKQQSGFIYFDSEVRSGWYYSYSDNKLILPGNKIDDKTQSAGEDSGGFFFTEGKAGNIEGKAGNIKEEMVLYSFIHFKDEATKNNFKTEFSDVFNCDNKIVIGKRKSGTVTFSYDIDGVDETKALTDDYLPLSKTESDKLLYIYCFSDLILVDEFLNYKEHIDKEDIIKTVDKELKNKITIERLGEKVYVRNSVVSGFNNALGFPLIQDKIIEKGSVFVFSIEKHDSNDTTELNVYIARLKDYLLKNGLGLRRGEGFGRILINPPFLTEEVYD